MSARDPAVAGIWAALTLAAGKPKRRKGRHRTRAVSVQADDDEGLSIEERAWIKELQDTNDRLNHDNA